MYKFQKTTFLKKGMPSGRGPRAWILLDASGKTLGRFASEVSKILRGKHRPDFTPHVDGGDGVVVINAEKIAVTGMKEARKVYRTHTGSMSGLREETLRSLRERRPDEILRRAVRRMMPKNKLSRHQLTRLRLFVGEEHTMQAQVPVHVQV